MKPLLYPLSYGGDSVCRCGTRPGFGLADLTTRQPCTDQPSRAVRDGWRSSATSPLRGRSSDSASAAAETSLHVGQVDVAAQDECRRIEDGRADQAENR